MENFIVSARKYRPATFDTVVGQSSIAQTLKNSILRKQLAHAYLFCGPRGVGKTTCARIFAKTINCMSPKENGEACGECESCKAFTENRSYNIHELDAASNNSVDDIRLLTEQVRVPPQIGTYSVYIIDEVHMLSTAAFNAFLKTLEEPPAHAIFILATTEKHKIIPTILSRCQIYDFNRIRVEDAAKHLAGIANSEGINCEPEALNIIAQKADGAMRDALSIFDQVVSFCGTNVTYAKVIENLHVLDYDYYFKLTDAFLTGDYCTALTIFDEVLSKGFDAQHFIRGLNSHFRDLLVCKDTRTTSLLEVGAAIAETYKKQADTCSVNFLFAALALANTCDVGYKTSSNQRLHVELALCKLSSITTQRTVEPTVKIVEKTTETTNIAEAEKTDETKIVSATEKPTEKTVETQEPAEQKIVEEEKKETPVERPQSLSIKGFGTLTETVNIPDSNSAVDEDVPEMNEPYSTEQLEKSWENYIDTINEKQVRLASAMKAAKPIEEPDNVIVFNVQNTLQRDYLVEKGIAKKIGIFLQKELKNSNIKLEVRIDESGDKVEKPLLYSDEDKEKFMREKNPDFLDFQKSLELSS